MKIGIVIPIYKSDLTPNEELSLRQCAKIFSDYCIIIVTNKSVNLSFYYKIFEKNNLLIEYFPIFFFQGIYGYNQLTLSRTFYLRFVDYSYILIYQTDAYVFRDELSSWAEKGYDYIGAPFICNYHNKIINENEFTFVGNGGFSLRKVSAFLDSYKGFRWYYLYCKSQVLPRHWFTYPRYIIVLIQAFYFKHSIAKKIPCQIFEDLIWSTLLRNKPSVEEAMLFSFEKKPSRMYALTGKKLPFGCHAWEKNEKESFWRSFIPFSR